MLHALPELMGQLLPPACDTAGGDQLRPCIPCCTTTRAAAKLDVYRSAIHSRPSGQARMSCPDTSRYNHLASAALSSAAGLRQRSSAQQRSAAHRSHSGRSVQRCSHPAAQQRCIGVQPRSMAVVRINTQGDVECMSQNNRDCLWRGNANECRAC